MVDSRGSKRTTNTTTDKNRENSWVRGWLTEKVELKAQKDFQKWVRAAI
jgi:hypothetical protein